MLDPAAVHYCSCTFILVKNSSGYDAFVVHNRPFSVSMTLNNDGGAPKLFVFTPHRCQERSFGPHLHMKEKDKKVTGAGVPLE